MVFHTFDDDPHSGTSNQMCLCKSTSELIIVAPDVDYK